MGAKPQGAFTPRAVQVATVCARGLGSVRARPRECACATSGVRTLGLGSARWASGARVRAGPRE